MAHSVIITTPMPTWDETVKTYGLTKADQKLVIRLVDEKLSRQPVASARKLRSASSKSAQNGTGRSGGSVRKRTNRVRTNA
jgi:hypothetical protein